LVDVQLDAIVSHPIDRWVVSPGAHLAVSHLNGKASFTPWLSLDVAFDL